MLKTQTKIGSVIAAMAIAGFALTGCAAGGQSKADACNEATKGISALQEDLTSSLSTISTDPQQAADAIDELADTFSDGVDKVTNEEVKPAAEKADQAISDMSDELNKFAEDPATADPTALTSSATAVQTTFTDLGKVCQ